jgi:hypothetical protein
MDISVGQSSFDYCRTAHYVRYQCSLSNLYPSIQWADPCLPIREPTHLGISHHYYRTSYNPSYNFLCLFAALSASSHLCASTRLFYLKPDTSRSLQSELPNIREATRAAFCLRSLTLASPTSGFVLSWFRGLLPPSSTVRTARPCTSRAYIDTTRRTIPPL